MTENKSPVSTGTASLPLLEEYKSLRAECREHLKTQDKLIIIMLLVFCSAVIFSLLDWRGLLALLFFPGISTLFVFVWSSHELKRVQINAYISDKLEPDLNLYWTTYQKIFFKARGSSAIRTAPLRSPASYVVLSVQWLFILLDITAVIMLIYLILCTSSGANIPVFFIAACTLGNVALIALKYWLVMVAPLEKYIALDDPTGTTVIKETHREMYPRCQQRLEEDSTLLTIAPAAQTKNYFNCLFKQILQVQKGSVEIKDGSVSGAQRLEHRNQYVRTCEPGDIAIIPPGFNYIIVNPSPVEPAVIKHRRILSPELLIR